MSTLVHVILSGITPGEPSEGQFIPAYSGKSLFQLCVERNTSFAQRQLVVGHNEYYVRARDYFKSEGNRAYLNIIEEDHLTNIYSVSFAAFSAGAEEILLVTPSGYSISEETAYKRAVEKMILMAKEEQIAALFFHSEQAIENIPFIVYEEDQIKSFELITDSKQIGDRPINKNQFIYSGIICCKANIYLSELKKWSPEIYQVAKNTWEARVAQYVAVDTTIKIPLATIEEVLLRASDKVRAVLEVTAKLEVPVKNIGGQITDSPNPRPETKSNKGPQMASLAL